MKLITCTCLFVTLLTLSNALVKELEQDAEGMLDGFYAENQKKREQEIVDATGEPLSEVRKMLSDPEQEIECSNGACIICVKDKDNCKVCMDGRCSSCRRGTCAAGFV